MVLKANSGEIVEKVVSVEEEPIITPFQHWCNKQMPNLMSDFIIDNSKLFDKYCKEKYESSK